MNAPQLLETRRNHHLPYDSLHDLMTFHQKKLQKQPYQNFRLNTSIIEIRSSTSTSQRCDNNVLLPRLEFTLIRRRLEDRGLFVTILDDSWDDLTCTAVQLLSLPDHYYEKMVYCHPVPYQVLKVLLPLNPSRRQSICWDDTCKFPEIALATLDSPIHLILYPNIFKQRHTKEDISQRFVECLAQRSTSFGSLTIYKNALSDIAWTQLLQWLNQKTPFTSTTTPILQTLELIDLNIHDATLLATAHVETLSLSHCSLADDGESLQRALSQQEEGLGPTRLVLDQVVGWENRLHHSRKTLPFDAWSKLMLTFAQPTCRVQHLELGSSPYYDIGGFFLAFLEGLAQNHSLQSLVIRKYDGILTFWDDLAEIVIHHSNLQSIALIYESSICHDAAQMFRAMSRILDIHRHIWITFDGDYHNRTFERMVVPKLRMNRFHQGTQTLCEISNDSVRTFLFVQALIRCCCCPDGGSCCTGQHLSRKDQTLRTWWLVSRNTDVLVALLQRQQSRPDTNPISMIEASTQN